MFPTLNYFFKYLFNADYGMNFPPTFGFLVALAFLGAAWVLGRELKRKEKLGLVKPVKRKVKVGEKATTTDLVSYGIFGFIAGFKLLAIILGNEVFKANPQAFLLSTQGNLIGGLLGAAALAGYVYWDKKRKSLPVPEEKEEDLHPYQMVGNITFYAAISGILGAKIFHQLEYWDNFVADPIGNLFSASGLTFYGGLIGGFLGVWYYVRKQKLPLIHVADAVAPGLILAYAIGRMGCMLSGDGDWGVINSAYRISEDRKYTVVSAEAINNDLYAIQSNGQTSADIFGGNGQPVDYRYFAKPAALSFMPDWFFAFDYPHNVNEEGIPLKDCKGQYCNRLPLPVFPTAMYETIMGLFIFLTLWLLRNRIRVAGMMFSIYLIMNGLERFFIEKIRVNTEILFLGMKITQAELIAVILILIGIVGVIFTPRLQKKMNKFS